MSKAGSAAVARGARPAAAPAQPQAGATAPAIELAGLTKTFGETTVLSPLDLRIEEGEFFSILGPSGCGKTTLMRLIAGFEEPTGGSIRLAGLPVAGVPTRKRDLNMVFQSYALFPHLSVRDNVAFELKVRGKKRFPTWRADVHSALELVRMGEFGARLPSQLSGGQRQRVALARAIVARPRLILLDEPLGALDQQLRQDMQLELKRLHRDVGITFVYVTHDQEEAMTMSDRIAVMSGGTVQQVGDPRTIYERPATRFVASFIGRCNLFAARLRGGPAGRTLDVEGLGLVPAPAGPLPGEGSFTLAIRPERMCVRKGTAQAGEVAARTEEAVFLGDEWRLQLRADGGASVLAILPAGTDADGIAGLRAGTPVALGWPASAAQLIST